MDIIEHILSTWETDCNIDKLHTGDESIKTASLHAKYLRFLVKYKLLLKKTKNEYAEERKIKYNYFSGHYNTNREMLEKLGKEPFKFILKQDMSIYMDSDKELMEISNKITLYEEVIAMCDRIMIELKNRVWEIKNYIDFIKWESGS